MYSNTLKPNFGSHHRRKRVGRGHGCSVKTAGRGSNGQGSRSGGLKAPGFEGGQTPWYRRLPKYRGFKNPFRVEFTEIAVGSLERFEDGDTVDPFSLLKVGLIRNLNNPIKVLGNGTLTKKLTVQLHAFTASSKEAIEKAGGTVEEI
ncbi:50S ribosomal protein L15 [bacterium]|nr:50S ribosomal protein L15 [bacterium]